MPTCCCQAWRIYGTPFERPQTFFTEHHGVRCSFELRINVTGVCSAWSQSRQFLLLWRRSESWFTDIQKLSGNNVTFQQDGASAQHIVHDKQRAPQSVEPENWPPNGPDLSLDYSIWRALQQLVYRHCRTRGTEHLKEVLESCKPAGSRLVRTLSIALQGRFANDCRSLLQPIEDTLSSALTNVFASTRTLSYLRVFL